MSHGVAVKTAPAGFEVLAHTEGAPVAAMQDESRKLYGVQWHPEVKHTPLGQKLIETFLHQCAGLPDNWGRLLHHRGPGRQDSARRSATPK